MGVTKSDHDLLPVVRAAEALASASPSTLPAAPLAAVKAAS